MNGCHSHLEKAVSKNTSSTFAKSFSSILSSIIIVILPKCPFCLVAYSSAVTLCSASGTIEHTAHHTDWGAYAAIALGMLIALCTLLTFKIRRGLILYILTNMAAMSGIVFVYLGIFRFHEMGFYYIGAALLLLAAFVYGDAYTRFFKFLK